MWFPYIPQNWSIKKLNHICTIITDYVASGSFADLAANVEYLDEPNYAMLIRTTDISDKGHNSKPVYISEKSYQFLSNSNLFGGEILLPNIGAVGDVYIVPRLYEKMSLAPNSIMLKTEYVDKYFYYFFFCDAGRKSLLNIAQSTAQPKFNKTQLRQLRVIVPPLDEQHRIADFLDRKCAEIDRVLEKTRASIEEYKKLKQSVITQAVTKGIRGEREMKDSGIEWIGEIPVDWMETKLKQLTYIRARLGWKGLKADEYVDEGYTFLSAFNIVNNKLDLTNVNYINQFRYDESPEIKLQIGDILIVKDGAGIGKCAFIDYLPNESTPNGSLAVITPSNKLFGKFLYYYFLSTIFQTKIQQLKDGMGVPHLFQRDLREITIPLPLFKEQTEIADYLDRKCSEIDTLISKKEQLITELEAYKKSLIYEYVTGKKEVQ